MLVLAMVVVLLLLLLLLLLDDLLCNGHEVATVSTHVCHYFVLMVMIYDQIMVLV